MSRRSLGLAAIAITALAVVLLLSRRRPSRASIGHATATLRAAAAGKL